MKFVSGKRQFRQEKVFGLVIVSDPVGKVRTFALVLGHHAWGFQWKWNRAKKR